MNNAKFLAESSHVELKMIFLNFTKFIDNQTLKVLNEAIDNRELKIIDDFQHLFESLAIKSIDLSKKLMLSTKSLYTYRK